jgi:Zn-dependent metalloprotease
MKVQFPQTLFIRRILYFFIGLPFFFMVSFSGIGQNIEDKFPVKKSNRNPDGTYSYIKFATETGPKKGLTLSAESLVSILSLSASHQMKIEQQSGLTEKTDIIFKEYYKGVPLAFSRVIVKAPGGQIKSIAGRYYEVPETLSALPGISEQTALENALAFVNADKYSWESNLRNEPELMSRPKGELVIVENIFDRSYKTPIPEAFILCYKFRIYAIEPLRFDEVFIDARQGNMVFTNPILKHGEGIADTRYSGKRSINTILYGGNYLLVDTNRNHPVETLNLKKGSNYFAATSFADKDNQWTNAEYNNAGLDNAALDAHWGSQKTYEFFKSKFNRNGFDGKGTLLKSYVHAGNKYSNAFWDGFGVTFGDGDSLNNGPFTSIDICGHEIAHGLCQFSANLIYFNESGAINESLSDIWGACIKHFAAPEKNHWLSGDEISLRNSYFRSFVNPKSKTQPDTYKGTNWYSGSFDNGGVHINSGVMNYWFYLLTTGKTGTNDFGFNYGVQGIGIEKAAEIVYRAETEYLYPTAQMIDARLATLAAAADLYGESALETQQVRNAWDAVGVTENLPTPLKLMVKDTNQVISLSWFYPGFVTDFDGFIIERKSGYDGSFAEIGRVAPDELKFWDTTFTANDLLTYRVRAYYGNILSDFSAPVYISLGNGPLVMKAGNFNVCEKLFLDPGGPLNYNNSSTITTTIRPSVPGKKIGVRFLKFSLEYPYDYLEIFNGVETYFSQRIGIYRGKNIPEFLKSTDTSGALTFRFYADNYNTDSGWVAEITCLDLVPPRPILNNVTADLPSGFIDLLWTDPSETESGFIIQRAVNDSSSQSFIEIGRVGANSTSFRDTSYPLHSALFYRVVASYSGDTAVSNFKWLNSGDLPFVMSHGMMVSTCNKTFLDPGGLGKYPVPAVNTSQVVVFLPSKTDSKVELNFSRFKLNYSDYLKIYNGWGTDKPVIGTFNGNSGKPTNIRSTSDDGRLTVEFFRYNYNISDSGWVANVGCYSYVMQPELIDISQIGNPATGVKVNWLDRSNIEESYMVQRAINDNTPGAYETISVLPPNSTTYTDTLPVKDAVYFYRIIGTSKGDSSKSNVWEFYSGNFPIIMPNPIEFIPCDKTFMDPAGLGIYAKPSQYASLTNTFAPQNPDDKLMVAFSTLKLGDEDNLWVYEGGMAAGTALGVFSKTTPLPTLLKSNSEDGKLTFVFNRSSYGKSDSGWVAKINCYKPVQKPVIDSIVRSGPNRNKIYWKEGSNNANGYIIQQSLNDSTERYMKTIATGPAGIKFFEDTTTIENAWAFYRIIAVNEIDTAISANKGILIGNAPLSMEDGVVLNSCDVTLLDIGGIGTYKYYWDKPTRKTVIVPDGPDKKIEISFKLLDLTDLDYLRIYEGKTISSDYLITEFRVGSTLPQVIKSKSPSGILTIVHQRNDFAEIQGNWEAKISCYTPVPAPTLDSVYLNTQKMNIQWTDRSANETNFIVQRAFNDSTPQSFETIALLAPNATNYADGSYPVNGFLFYRVGAILGMDTSFSKTRQIGTGMEPIIMNDYQVINTCDAVFLDPGGLGDYSEFADYSTFTTLIKPAKTNTVAEINFTNFELSPGDVLKIYLGDGSNQTSETLIGSYYGDILPPPNIRGQLPDGNLVAVFNNNWDQMPYIGMGWVANITCYKPLRAPEWVNGTLASSNSVSLKWNNTPDDETQYLVQHAVNQPHFQTGSFIAIRPANDTVFTHNAPQPDAVNFYRVASIRGMDTAWSEVFSIALGDAPFISEMDSVLVTCDETFMDPGGIGLYMAEEILEGREVITTFVPGTNGKKIGIDFTSFKLDGTDHIEIFNGENLIYDNIIDRYYGFETRKPGRILSKSIDGKLTVRFRRLKGNVPDSGWFARVFCYEEIERPTNPIIKRAGENKFKINFTDNSGNESGFVLEKCAGDCNTFMPVDTLGQNMTEFIDSVPANIGQVRYRVRAIYQDFTSNFSDTAILMKANGSLNMMNANVSLSSMDFYDTGGKDIGYTYNEKYQVKFYPLDSAKKVKLTFESFSTEAGQDSVQIFDGAQQGAKRIAIVSGTTIIPSVTSKSEDGSLRFAFRSNDSYNYFEQGWKATLSATYGLQPPYNTAAMVKDDSHVLINWSDSNKLPVQFIVESSYKDTLHFAPIATVAANTFAYIDSNVVPGIRIYYRVASAFEVEKSTFSPMTSATIGTICNNPVLTTLSAKGTSLVNQVNNLLTDNSCKLIAKIESINSNPVTLNKVRSSVWITDTFPSFNGVKYGKRHYNIIPENYKPGNSSWLTLYFTQNEFDEFNNQTNGKLLPKNPGDTLSYNNIRILGTQSNGIDLQSPPSYPLPPLEANIITSIIKFNIDLNAYEIKVLLNGPSAFFLSSANDTIYTSCNSDEVMVSVQSNKIGYTYQWQKEGAAGFSDLKDDGNFEDTRTPVMRFRKGSLPDGTKLRCMVFFSPSKTYVIENKEMEWVGLSDTLWSNPANWSCGKVPGPENRVRIKPGTLHLPVISADITLKELMVLPGAKIIIADGVHITITN